MRKLLAALLVSAFAFSASAQVGPVAGGSAFNPAIPGPIGGTTPDVGTFTQVNCNAGTITVSTPCPNVTQTWNAGAVVFTASKIDVTNTASAAGSLLQDWQVGGVSQANIDRIGTITGGVSTANQIQLNTSSSPSFQALFNSAVRGRLDMGGGAGFDLTLSAGATTVASTGSIRLNGTVVTISGTDTGFARNAAGVVEVNNGTAGVFADIKARQFLTDCTVTAIGTTGNVTINKGCGTANIAAAGTTVTITNSLVTANTVMSVTARTNDSTCSVKNYVPGAGTVTINTTAACTGTTSFGYVIGG